ncbi:MAG TPA: LysR family transcriptional regulator [Steroidobacteraceae bacterium]|nr:LysR family transcriptional regulator [Steroidobacteraceae bacterium]
MQHLDNILVFVKVAEFESISKAARALDMPVSTVSRRLSVLESDLGVSLVRRTTRSVILTSQGRDYFNQCTEPLMRLQEAEQVLTQTQRKPEGTLAISVPMILSQGPFMDFLSRLSKEHSRIRIDLYITNAYLNLVAENIDVAIRFGHLTDSSVVAAKLGKSVRYVVATAGYLEGRRLPTEPEELKAYDCVMFNARNHETDWDLICGRKKVRVHVTGNVSSRDCQSAAAFVLRGHGIGLLETGYCDQALARGDLVRLLPRWTSAEIPVFAVYPTRKFLPPRVTAFLKALATWKSPLWGPG